MCIIHWVILYIGYNTQPHCRYMAAMSSLQTVRWSPWESGQILDMIEMNVQRVWHILGNERCIVVIGCNWLCNFITVECDCMFQIFYIGDIWYLVFWWLYLNELLFMQMTYILEYPMATKSTGLLLTPIPTYGLGSVSVNTYTAKPVCWNGWISDSYCSLKPLCSGMGEVVPARTSPTLLPPSPRTVLKLSCFKVSQCINCRD